MPNPQFNRSLSRIYEDESPQLKTDLHANGKKITNLADGVASTDAATVGQIGGAAAASGDTTATPDTLVKRDADAGTELAYLDFDTAAVSAFLTGRVRWNDTDKCLEYDSETGTTISIGQELVVRVKNQTGSTISNGAPVYISGASAGRPRVSLADADTLAKSQTLIGLVTTDGGIAHNTEGFVTIAGIVHGLNTAAFTIGDILYLSDGTSGTLTNTKPTALTSFITRVGFCLTSDATDGHILVSPQFYGSVIGDNLSTQTTTANARTVIDASKKLTDTGTGETLISNTDGVLKKLIQGSNITLTPGADGITIASSGGGGGSYVGPIGVKTAPSISSGTLTLDLASGANNMFVTNFTSNITTLTISNVPATGTEVKFRLQLVADGTARTVTWPASVKWAFGIAPSLTATNTKIDEFEFHTHDGGTTYFASIIGQSY